MNRVLILLRGDLRQLAYDPMLIFFLVAPLMLIAAVSLGIPAFAVLLQREAGFDLIAYYPLVLNVALLMIPLILGVMNGFLLLDERDEKLIDYFAVTPLTKTGYIAYRLLLPISLSFIYVFLLLALNGLVPVRAGSFLLTMPVLVLETPLVTLFMAAFAANKVEGLALSKGLGILLFVPAVVHFVPYPWQLLGGIVPSFWVAAAHSASMSVSPPLPGLLCCLLGLAAHYLALRYLLRRFMHKLD
ncbi:hypothetical protein [Paenibacillus sp. GCM10027626]|uniref:hypothetical protein n=1 Tax=Paenibacillus sp. GCM10027626 TaxID=3273411 RepID=UPI0036412581